MHPHVAPSHTSYRTLPGWVPRQTISKTSASRRRGHAEAPLLAAHSPGVGCLTPRHLILGPDRGQPATTPHLVLVQRVQSRGQPARSSRLLRQMQRIIDSAPENETSLIADAEEFV